MVGSGLAGLHIKGTLFHGSPSFATPLGVSWDRQSLSIKKVPKVKTPDNKKA